MSSYGNRTARKCPASSASDSRAGPSGGGRAVVAVGDVERVDPAERLHERGGLVDGPDRVLDVVLGPEVVDRRALHGPGDGVVDGVVAAVSQHDRLGVGPLREHVARPVVLLVGPRVLVLEDDVVVVVLGRDQPDEPRLGPAVHDQAVHVEPGGLVADEGAGLGERAERLGPLLVDLVGVLVGPLGQVDLGADDVQERVLVAGGQLARLRGRDDVVGDGGDALGVLGRRAERAERADGGHGGRFGEGVPTKIAGPDRRATRRSRSVGVLFTVALHPALADASPAPYHRRPTAGWRSGISSGS